MWIDVDDDHLLVNTEVHRQKDTDIQRDPRVAVAVLANGDAGGRNDSVLHRRDGVIASPPSTTSCARSATATTAGHVHRRRHPDLGDRGNEPGDRGALVGAQRAAGAGDRERPPCPAPDAAALAASETEGLDAEVLAGVVTQIERLGSPIR